MLSVVLKAVDAVNKIKLKSNPLPVLYFHRVLPTATAFCPDDWHLDNFQLLIRKLSKHFTLMSLEDALQCLENNTLPSNALCLTFDDGYQDNYELAAPVIESVGGKASFFVSTQGTERGYLWNDELLEIVKCTRAKSLVFHGKHFTLDTEKQKAAAYLSIVGQLKVLPNSTRDSHLIELQQTLGKAETPRCMMTASQLVDLQNRGHCIGAHTHTHSILAYQADDVAFNEIELSVMFLNKLLPKNVTCFAYPNGWFGRDFNEQHEEMLGQSGVAYGFATNDGGITLNSPKTRLPRFMPHRKELNQFCISIKKIAGEKLSD